MKVRSVDLVGSYGISQGFPEPREPEFIFVGRSNVGKSALINVLTGRRNIARTSNSPGKTRTANFYSINGQFFFIDVPGYGYARVSKLERRRWHDLTASYLETRPSLQGVIHLLDVRHRPSSDDSATSLMLRESGRPVCLVFNKIDKVKRRDVDRKIGQSLSGLSVERGTAVIPFSAETGMGKRALWAWIEDRLSL